MKKKTESSDRDEENAEALFRAVAALRRGEVIVFPTETFYGLGADAFNERAVERVVSLKGRGSESPIAVIIADIGMLDRVAAEVARPARRLIERFWPGALTLILPAKKNLSALLLNRDGKIGVRISSHPLATRLARELGHPLTATSANPSGKEPARTVEEARSYFAGRLEIFLDGGRLEGGKGSTVVEVSSRGVLRIIRGGAISSLELEEAVTSGSKGGDNEKARR